MCDPCTCSTDPSDVVQAHRQAVLDSLSGEYETPEDRALVDALIEAVRAQCASRFAFAVLSASTLPAARSAVERIIEELPI